MTHTPHTHTASKSIPAEIPPAANQPYTFMENVIVLPDGSATWVPLAMPETFCQQAGGMASATAAGSHAGPVPSVENSAAHTPAAPATYTICYPRSPSSPRLRELWLMAGVFVLLLLPLYWFPLWAKNIDSPATAPISCKTP